MNTTACDTYTVNESAVRLGASRRTIDRMLAHNVSEDGQRSAIVIGGESIPAMRIGMGGRWGIARRPLDALLCIEAEEAGGSIEAAS